MSHELLLILASAVLLLPLASFLLLIFFSKRIPRDAGRLSTSIIFGTLGLSLIIMLSKLVIYPADVIQISYRWAFFENLPGIGAAQIDVGMMIDNLSAVMLVVVTLISALVHMFSIGYMKDDIRYSRYFAYLGFFSFSMLMIVLANNFFNMYVGWELVGLSSYLLIGHWYEKKSASDAAIKAFVVNRVGDLGMLAGVMILFANFHSLSFDKIFPALQAGQLPFGNSWWLTFTGIAIFCAAVGKSAQFPLHVWLPDAMEGPTPVSALIHAATMVAAGVYLIARVYALFTADALMVIAYIGAFTAFISATIAIAQNDIKKVLAYSTISQLGYMIMALGVGAYASGFFHLVTHAMFKAGLFLGSGSVIYAMQNALHHQGDNNTDAQDIRNMGGLRSKMPLTFWTFVVYTLAICGIPFTSGFLSKDEILAGTLAFGQLTGHWIIPVVAFFVAGLTAFYMFRILILTFLGEPKDPERIQHIHESPAVMLIPLVTLALLSIFVWFSFNPMDASNGWICKTIGRPTSVVPSSLAAPAKKMFEATLHHSHSTAFSLSLLVAGLGILVAYSTYRWKKIDADKMAEKAGPLYRFLLNKWYIDELYDFLFVRGAKNLAKVLAWFDNNIIDGAVNGVAWLTKIASYASGKFDDYVVDGIVNLTAYATGFLGLLFRKVQTGRIQTYLIFVIIGVMVFFYLFRTW